MIFDNTNNFQRISNDYNVVFLPKTQFTDLSFKEVILKDLNLTEEVAWNKKSISIPHGTVQRCINYN